MKILAARTVSYYYVSMQCLSSTPTTEDDAASIPAEHVRNGPDLNQYPTFTVRRKAAKRTFPWDLAAGEIHFA